MAKNANKILKEIAVKMGGNVGEKDNDTNEFLTSIAKSMGATLDKKHNTNELLEIIAENIGEGESGSGGSGSGSMVLPLGQTNPYCYYYKPFSSASIVSIDFTKFVDWYERLGFPPAPAWGTADNPIPFEIIEFDYGHHSANYSYYTSYGSSFTLCVYDNYIDLIIKVGYDEPYPTIRLASDVTGKSIMECLREVGVVNIDLSEYREVLPDINNYIYFNMPQPCFLYSILGCWYEAGGKVYPNQSGKEEDAIDCISFINSVDWLKISEK